MNQIKDVKVTMFQYGLNAPNLSKKKVFCLTTVKIIYMDDSVVEKYINELSGKFRKSDLKSIAICSDFFVIAFKTEWAIMSPEGDYVMSMSPCGQIIGVDNDCFLVRKDNTITGYNGKGEKTGCRELTKEEIETLRSDPQ